MTFVFESRLLPFGDITETYAGRIRPIVAHYALDELPLWDRCMLAAVLPVVQQRHSAGTTAAPSSAALSSVPLRPNGSDNGDASTAAGVLTSSRPSFMGAARNEERAKASEGMTDTPSLEDVALALNIARALDELEAVYDSSRSTRAELKRQHHQGGPSGAAAEASCHTFSRLKTSEAILMEDLMQERFCDSAPYLPESSDDDGEGGGEAELDVAMCFTVKGESLGIGSANVFGGHGWHPS
ncbi:hypothetical protein LSCM1_07547 [Leishmania martiniquensis]|uniref:Uncharacterized protein n=1 Tax=Leishmania martiniquensis TaxID=1580590 RepID=A0A836HQ33_9TRYP|nr:hypothetical protein LSCM1_07547 [Leishmania martiniquensis]